MTAVEVTVRHFDISKTNHHFTTMAYQFQISAKILSWPRKCACCGDIPDSHLRAGASKTTGKRVVNTKTSWWEVPYCAVCLAHKGAYDSASGWVSGGTAVGFAVWCLIGFGMGNGRIGFLVGSAVIATGYWRCSQAREASRLKMKPSCCAPSAAVKYLDWHGTFHTFVFESESYLDEFLAVNGRKTRSDVRKV